MNIFLKREKKRMNTPGVLLSQLQSLLNPIKEYDYTFYILIL